MADFATALRARLVNAATAAGSRIYPVIVPQSPTFPYIRYQTVSDPRPEHLKGYDGARVTRVQVDCFTKPAEGIAGYATARSLAEAVIAALATPATVGGVQFGRVKAEGPEDLGEDTTAGFVHRARLGLLVEHRLA